MKGKALHFGINAVLAMVAVLGIANSAFAYLYRDRIYPGVVIEQENFGGKTIQQAKSLLQEPSEKYSLKVVIASKEYKVSPKEAGMKYDVEATAYTAFSAGRSQPLRLAWFLQRNKKIAYSYSLDTLKFQTYIEQLATKSAVAPKDATIIIKAGQPTIVPEQAGSALNKEQIKQLASAALSQRVESLQVKLEPVPPKVKSSDLSTSLVSAKKVIATQLLLKFEDKRFVPSGAEISSWLVFASDSNLKAQASIDQSKLRQYLETLAKQIYIAPVNKNVNMENGVKVSESGGVVGRAVNIESLAQLVSGALLSSQNREIAIPVKEVAFKTTTNNALSLDGKYIEVNLTSQRLWAYDNHQLMYESAVTSGATKWGFGTVTGMFSILTKVRNTRLVGYQYGWNYDVAVKYWMPFYKGYGLHDASWRNGVFGGPDYYWNGSHGCVNLPDATAAWIFDWAPVGTPVWVHN